MAQITVVGFLKFLVESIGDEAVLFETYAANSGATLPQKRDLIDTLRQAGIELGHTETPPVQVVANNIAAREAREQVEKEERQLQADKNLKRELTEEPVKTEL